MLYLFQQRGFVFFLWVEAPLPLVLPLLAELFVPFVSSCIASGMLLLLQLSAMDVSARTTMKGAAKCDKHCELQNSVNQ